MGAGGELRIHGETPSQRNKMAECLKRVLGLTPAPRVRDGYTDLQSQHLAGRGRRVRSSRPGEEG